MDGTNKNFVSIKEASTITGISPQTLRKLGDTKKIQCYKTISGQRRFNKASLEELCNPTSIRREIQPIQPPIKQNYIYARVSSKKQLDDLSRQIEYLQRKKPEFSFYPVITDVASGINFKRKGLQTLLDSCIQRTIGEIVIAHRDRLCMFGYELFELFVEKSGGIISVMDDNKYTSTEQELAEDLLSIIHIYSCKQMGKRKYKLGNTTGNITGDNDEITECGNNESIQDKT
jgi:predicted site-specific integrase-resolvase